MTRNAKWRQNIRLDIVIWHKYLWYSCFVIVLFDENLLKNYVCAYFHWWRISLHVFMLDEFSWRL